MTADFQHDALPNQWVHPETGVRINCEDMPPELTPTPTPRKIQRSTLGGDHRRGIGSSLPRGSDPHRAYVRDGPRSHAPAVGVHPSIWGVHPT